MSISIERCNSTTSQCRRLLSHFAGSMAITKAASCRRLRRSPSISCNSLLAIFAGLICLLLILQSASPPPRRVKQIQGEVLPGIQVSSPSIAVVYVRSAQQKGMCLDSIILGSWVRRGNCVLSVGPGEDGMWKEFFRFMSAQWCTVPHNI